MGKLFKYIYVICSLSFVLMHSLAIADEPQNYFKYTCIPELNYLEITSVFSYETLGQEVREKYNMIPAKMECPVWGKIITISLEFDTWAGWDSPAIRLKSWNYDDVNYKLTLNADGVPLVTIEDFGAYQYYEEGRDILPGKFPHMLTFDGNVVNVCTGLLVRNCKTHRIDWNK